jgi:hypothetical protein
LKDNPTLVCPACGVVAQIESDASVTETIDALNEVDRLLGKF